MHHVMVKHPGVQIDIMVPKEHWPKLVGIISRTNCFYKKEDEIDIPNGKSFVILRDVQAGSMHAISEFFDYLNLIQYDVEVKDGEQPKKLEDKFYILMRPKKRKVKKNADKDRKEVYERREGGAGREPANDIQPGSADGSSGGSDSAPVAVNADPGSVPEPETTNDDHN